MIRLGDGDFHPGRESTVQIKMSWHNFDGSDLSWTTRDAPDPSEAIWNPIIEYANIPGLQMAMTIMTEGDIWEIFVPSNMGYGLLGNRNDPSVNQGQALRFRVEMISIVPPGRLSTRCLYRDLFLCSDDDRSIISEMENVRTRMTEKAFVKYTESTLKSLGQIEKKSRVHSKKYIQVKRTANLYRQFLFETLNNATRKSADKTMTRADEDEAHEIRETKDADATRTRDAELQKPREQPEVTETTESVISGGQSRDVSDKRTVNENEEKNEGGANDGGGSQSSTMVGLITLFVVVCIILGRTSSDDKKAKRKERPKKRRTRGKKRQ